MSAVTPLESREYCYIKANNNYKLTLEKAILTPLLPGLEHAPFRVLRSTVPALCMGWFGRFVLRVCIRIMIFFPSWLQVITLFLQYSLTSWTIPISSATLDIFRNTWIFCFGIYILIHTKITFGTWKPYRWILLFDVLSSIGWNAVAASIPWRKVISSVHNVG